MSSEEDPEIRALVAAVDDAEHVYQDAVAKLRLARTQRAEFQAGDEVEVLIHKGFSDAAWQRGRVSGVKPMSSWNYYHVLLYKKDGSLGKAERRHLSSGDLRQVGEQ